MSGEWLYASLSENAKHQLCQSESDFCLDTFGNQRILDGPCLFRCIYDEVNPTTKAGTSAFKILVEKATMKQFQNDVKTANLQLSEWYDEIILVDKHWTEDMLRHLFRIYLTSPIDEFNRYMSDYKTQWEQGKSFKVLDIFTLAKTKYNNLKAETQWKPNDQIDQKLISLLTKASKKVGGVDPNAKTNSGKYWANLPPLPEWRKTKTETTITCEDKTWNRCKFHCGGKGMYVDDHTQEEHQQRIDAKKKAKADGKDSAGTEAAIKSSNLVLNDELKKSLLNIRSEQDAMALLTQLGAEN